MLKIGLISDTHGFLDDSVFKHFTDCDEIWHAGDIGTLDVAQKLEKFKPLRAVYGNIDGQEIRNIYPEDLWFYAEGLRVWITHIGGYPPKYNKRTRNRLKEKSPDIMICGHSHIVKVIKDPVHSLLHINPGAAGHQGFHKIKTLMKFNISGRKTKDMKVIELANKKPRR